MLATAESIDQLLAEATRQTAKNSAFAQDAARLYLRDLSEANHSQFTALDALQQAVLNATLDLQSAVVQITRSVLEVPAQLNRSIAPWTIFAVSPWALAIAAAGVGPVGPSHSSPATSDADRDLAGDYAMSALHFRPPLGIISSGLGESDD